MRLPRPARKCRGIEPTIQEYAQKQLNLNRQGMSCKDNIPPEANAASCPMGADQTYVGAANEEINIPSGVMLLLPVLIRSKSTLCNLVRCQLRVIMTPHLGWRHCF